MRTNTGPSVTTKSQQHERIYGICHFKTTRKLRYCNHVKTTVHIKSQYIQCKNPNNSVILLRPRELCYINLELYKYWRLLLNVYTRRHSYKGAYQNTTLGNHKNKLKTYTVQAILKLHKHIYAIHIKTTVHINVKVPPP